MDTICLECSAQFLGQSKHFFYMICHHYMLCKCKLILILKMSNLCCSIKRNFWISSSWDYHFFHLWGKSRVDGILKNKTKNMQYHWELSSALGQSSTDWIFTDCDNSLVSHKVKNFGTERYQRQIYYSTWKFYKNFTVCFMNDSSCIPMTESSITLCISKDCRLRVRIFEMTWSHCLFMHFEVS